MILDRLLLIISPMLASTWHTRIICEVGSGFEIPFEVSPTTDYTWQVELDPGRLNLEKKINRSTYGIGRLGVTKFTYSLRSRVR
jgi:hypothetical protein